MSGDPCSISSFKRTAFQRPFQTFKLIPRLTNWEDILDVMSPDKWSAAAMFQATRMFASNMSEGLSRPRYPRSSTDGLTVPSWVMSVLKLKF